MNLKYNNIDAKLDTLHYWDFEVSVDEDGQNDKCEGIFEKDLVIWMDLNNSGTTTDFKTLTSLICQTIPSGLTLNDIGLTGVDNGFVGNLSGETLTFSAGTQCFTMKGVTGDTYDYSIVESKDFSGKYVNLAGGFYQGFFKLEDYEYQLFPPRNNLGWTSEIWLSNRNDETISGETLNNVYTGNTGMFFYLGTRAENKFWNIFSGETGLTTTTEINLSPDEIKDYNLDIYDNCIGFLLTPDGRIGYRKIYFKNECIDDLVVTGLTIEEKYSDYTILTGSCFNSWLHIAITWKPYFELEDDCDFKLADKRKGVLTIWVNGKRVMRVNDFDEILLKGLNDDKDKQLGVPYNISIGGGTQGLIESKTFGGVDIEDKELEIEKNFAGSFYGGLSQFRFYTRGLNGFQIRNNFRFEQNRYLLKDTFGGRKIIISGIDINCFGQNSGC
jgi:hypothetical protein